ncbi:MAG: hypothetical protein ACFFD4_31370 [Candidatus Odinarchaeota archaeon]
MIDKTNILSALLERLDKLPVGHHLDVRPYKRNRSVMVVRKSERMYEIIEEGFFSECFSVEASKLKKTLRAVIKKEFPRSHKIRVYAMGVYSEEDSDSIERKKI